MSTKCYSTYLHSVLDPYRLRKVMKTLYKVIKTKIGEDNFDAFAYRGMSGAGVATALSVYFCKPLIMIRKKGTESHSQHLVEGARDAKRIVVIDDCISTGETLKEIVSSIIENSSRSVGELQVVAVVLFNDAMTNYYLLTGEETLPERFKTIFSETIRKDVKNRKVFQAMEGTKFYSFSTRRLSDTSYAIEIGSNLELDDLK